MIHNGTSQCIQQCTLPTADSWYRKPSPRLCPGVTARYLVTD